MVLSITCSKCNNKDEKIFKEEESIEILKMLCLINNIEEYQKIIMPEENINQEFRLKKLEEIRNYLIEEQNRNELMSKKHKKVCRVLNYIEHSLIVTSTITGCIPIFTFASLVGIPIGITCVITAGIKKYKSINGKKKKKHDNIVLLTKSKLNSIEPLISKALIDSNISMINLF